MPAKKTTTQKKKKCCNYILPLIYLVIVLALLCGAAKVYIISKQFEQSMADNTYQAVFLTNGQVYFGQLAPLHRGYFELNNVYYLQVNQELQPQDAETETQANQQKFSLVKLGNELHQPQSDMVINKEHILFWENLRTDSQVLKTILEQ